MHGGSGLGGVTGSGPAHGVLVGGGVVGSEGALGGGVPVPGGGVGPPVPGTVGGVPVPGGVGVGAGGVVGAPADGTATSGSRTAIVNVPLALK